MEIGVYTFADVDPEPGGIGPAQRVREVVEEIALADEVGLDVFGVGEHHRADYAASAPAMILAAAAERTSRIRLTSAVSVLSSDDPVRVFQQFATLDLLSGGRAEIMAGRGSFIESFPLFGHDLSDYDELFAEKLDLLLALRSHERVTWSGRHCPALTDQPVHPRPIQDPLPVWVAVGGNPQSVVRAGALGLPLAVAIIGGQPERFAPLVELYREAARRSGHTDLPVSLNTHGFVAETREAAIAQYHPGHAEVMNRIGRERGWPPSTRADFVAQTGLRGAMAVGSPEEVAEKILFQHEIFGHQRSLTQLALGTVAHRDVMRAIELLGTEVAPIVRAEVARRETAPAATG
ncbi:LLM class flavin-dependent oxidoreductase [Pseudonocardia bannensis]|uniref:LLM class flavin-dependent oxidoreductase n=1 Tax=Pseudonocardia bannensis TaxID=630973 RepID=A0A848DJ95_9PSEU|nr:LLM class flavin-dependent oxidoreductase [Pseudonocardia bannensis]NMH92606.1 LLM class flavin-dependent oxidoreductase [Pseudonocardia bannensis]